MMVLVDAKKVVEDMVKAVDRGMVVRGCEALREEWWQV